MPAQKLQWHNEAGSYCHVFNKGIDERSIFIDGADYEVFLGYIQEYLSAPLDPESTKKDFVVNGRAYRGTPHQPKNYFGRLELVVYSLKPDHFNLLLYQNTAGSVEAFIRSLCTRYSIYFNKKYHRSGTLFAGPYKAAAVHDDRVLLLSKYLHQSGDQTSYAEYLQPSDKSWVNSQKVLAKLPADQSYQDYIDQRNMSDSDIDWIKNATFDADSNRSEINQDRSVDEPASQDTSPSPLIPEQVEVEVFLSPFQRIPELLGTVVIFLLLVAIGVMNISVTSAKDNQSPAFEISTVSPSHLPIIQNSARYLKIVAVPTPTPSETDSAVDPELTSSSSATPVATDLGSSSTPSAKLSGGSVSTSSASAEAVSNIKLVIVSLSPEMSSTAVYQLADESSRQTASVKDGDVFVVASIRGDWVEIKLDNGLTGFIRTKYIKLETNN